MSLAISVINKHVSCQTAEKKEERLQQRRMRYMERTSRKNAEETLADTEEGCSKESLGRDRISTAKACPHNGITFD